MTKSFINQNINESSIINVNLAIYVKSYSSIIIIYIYIYMPVCVRGLYRRNVQTLEIRNICKNIKGASFFTITRLGPLLSREEANGMYKENTAKKGKTHMYEMY